MGVINTDKYKAISDNIASAKAQLTYAVAQMYSAVYTIALLDDIIQSVDLIQPMSTVYELTDNTFSRTSLFDGAVLAINNHVLRRSADHSLNAFLETDGTKVAPLFAELSANLGFIISEGNIETELELPTISWVTSAHLDSYTNWMYRFALTSIGSSAVTEVGIVWANHAAPTIADNKITEGVGAYGTGNYEWNQNGPFGADGIDKYLRGYATNSVGTTYTSVELSFYPGTCLAKGTMVSLVGGISKPIEDIEYSDELLVWNFDEGRFDSARPVWIKKEQEAPKYNELLFSDGSMLKTIGDHRIFNRDANKFTYVMKGDAAPIGTSTFNADGETLRLVSKRVVHENVEYYNIMSNQHINLFANGILTSSRFNNLYEISGMKFIKDSRVIKRADEFPGIPEELYLGLRLGEQSMTPEVAIRTISALMSLQKSEESALLI
jgi:hypothetical protein